MTRAVMGSLLMVLSLTACQDDVLIVGDTPAAPRALSASYYAGAVTIRARRHSRAPNDPGATASCERRSR